MPDKLVLRGYNCGIFAPKVVETSQKKMLKKMKKIARLPCDELSKEKWNTCFFSTRSIVKNTDARQHNALILIALGNEFVIAPAKAHSLLNLNLCLIPGCIVL